MAFFQNKYSEGNNLSIMLVNDRLGYCRRKQGRNLLMS